MGGARGGAGQGGRLPRRQGRDLCQDRGVPAGQEGTLQCHQGRDLCQDRGIPAGQEGTLPGVVVAGLGRRGGC